MSSTFIGASCPRTWVPCGASGTGKDTLVNRLVAECPELFATAVSHTTRAPRQGEVDGKAYHFVTDEVFVEMIARGDFVESVQVHGRRYGITEAAIDAIHRTGKICLVILDVHGLQQLVEQHYLVLGIWIAVDDPKITLPARLALRGDKAEDIAIRMKTAKAEQAYYDAHPERFGITLWSRGIDDTFISLWKHVIGMVEAAFAARPDASAAIQRMRQLYKL